LEWAEYCIVSAMDVIGYGVSVLVFDLAFSCPGSAGGTDVFDWALFGYFLDG